MVAPHAIKLPRPFVPTNAMKAIIPGNFAAFPRWEDSSDMLCITAWMCTNCKTSTLPDWEDTISFPFDANITELVDTLHFTNAKGKNILLIFATHDAINCECISCGRFTGAVLGVALFTERNKLWELSAFNYELGCFGAFQQLPKIRTLKPGNDNYEFYFLNANGAAGGVYYSELFIFGLLNGTFKKVLNIPAVRRTNTGLSNWDMSLKSIGPAKAQKITPIEMTLKGTFLKDTSDLEYGSTDVPPGLEQYAAKNDSFEFTVTYKYSFSNGTYHKTGTNVAVKK